jgi:hypothetical protein
MYVIKCIIIFFSSCSHFGALLPFWSIGLISQVLVQLQTVGLLGRVISSSQGLYLNTEQHKHRINAYIHTHTHTHTPNIHALSGIRIHDPGFRASEDSTCLRPLGYRDRRLIIRRPKCSFFASFKICRSIEPWLDAQKKWNIQAKCGLVSRGNYSNILLHSPSHKR